MVASLSAATFVVDSSTITGSYNPLNKISATAPGSSSTASAFQSSIASAFTAGNGAVWGFNQNGTILSNAEDTWSLTFATNKILSIAQDANMRYNNFGSAGATSSPGTGNDMFSAQSGASTYTLTFSLSGSNIGANEKILEVGLAALNRSNGTTPVYTVTARLDDNTTISLSDTLTVGTVDTDNTHFSIAATAGRYITALTVSATNSQTAIIDDFSFITGNVTAVPEPSTFAALAGVAMLGVAALRRRRS